MVTLNAPQQSLILDMLEDLFLKEMLYRKVMEFFVRRLEARTKETR